MAERKFFGVARRALIGCAVLALSAAPTLSATTALMSNATTFGGDDASSLVGSLRSAASSGDQTAQMQNLPDVACAEDDTTVMATGEGVVAADLGETRCSRQNVIVEQLLAALQGTTLTPEQVLEALQAAKDSSSQNPSMQQAFAEVMDYVSKSRREDDGNDGGAGGEQVADNGDDDAPGSIVSANGSSRSSSSFGGFSSGGSSSGGGGCSAYCPTGNT